MHLMPKMVSVAFDTVFYTQYMYLRSSLTDKMLEFRGTRCLFGPSGYVKHLEPFCEIKKVSSKMKGTLLRETNCFSLFYLTS